MPKASTAKSSHFARVSVYDAVARRVNSRGYIPLTPRFARTRDRPTSSTVALPPDEILFRSKGAPDRNDEDINHDIYSWTRTLPAGLELPESDLLTAVHSYVADFYGTLPDSKNDFESLDGTALIAMSMLLEEMAGEALGKTGDLALTEAAGEDSAQQPKWWNGKREVPHVLVQYTVADRMMTRNDANTKDGEAEETEPPTEAEQDDESSDEQDDYSSDDEDDSERGSKEEEK